MKKTKSAGGVIKNSEGKILVVSQHGVSWSLPKGHIEQGEDPLVASKREIEEESGITDLTFIKELGTYERFKIAKDGKGEDTSKLKAMHMFLYTTNESNLKPIDPENPEARWVDPQQVADLLTHPKDKEFFLKILPIT
jgi:ADP-ribose pyrophosphatase YjhB (NUDIX family)